MPTPESQHLRDHLDRAGVDRTYVEGMPPQAMVMVPHAASLQSQAALYALAQQHAYAEVMRQALAKRAAYLEWEERN